MIGKQPKKEVKDSKSRKIEEDPDAGIASDTQAFPEHVVGKCVTQMENAMNFFWPMIEYQELLMSTDFKPELVKIDKTRNQDRNLVLVLELEMSFLRIVKCI